MKSDILNQLTQEARKLRVGRKLPEADPIPFDLVEAVRDDFAFMLDQPGVTMDKVAQAMGPGFSRGVLGRFKNLKSPDEFHGSLDRVTRGINQFMETLARRDETPRPEGFVETEAARKMLVVIAKTIELNAIGLIYGDAGRGKTLTLKAAAQIHPGSVLVRVLNTTRTPSTFAKHLASLLHLRGCHVTRMAETRIIETLRDTGRALLIDEAHQLKPDTLELLRDIHDECGVPIILAGTVKISQAVDDHEVFFGQFTSRIALRYDLTETLRGDGGHDPKPLHTVEEIRRLYESDKVRFTDDGRLLLAKIANQPGLGGLRLCAKIVQVAASVAGEKPIDAELLLRVVHSLYGRDYAAGAVERAVERSRLKIA